MCSDLTIPSESNATILKLCPFRAESYANNLGLCGAPLESCKPSPKKFIVLYKEGFLVGWVVAMVTVVVVMFCNIPILLVKKAMTKKNKKLMKAGTRWCSTDERSKNMMVIS